MGNALCVIDFYKSYYTPNDPKIIYTFLQVYTCTTLMKKINAHIMYDYSIAPYTEFHLL